MIAAMAMQGVLAKAGRIVEPSDLVTDCLAYADELLSRDVPTKQCPAPATPALNPCPFCGGPASFHESNRSAHYVSCENDCGVRPETDYHDTAALAAETWNTRATTETPDPGLMEDVVQFMRDVRTKCCNHDGDLRSAYWLELNRSATAIAVMVEQSARQADALLVRIKAKQLTLAEEAVERR